MVSNSVYDQRSGIYQTDNCDQQSPNHVMLPIGFGTNSDGDFWTLRNSWGVQWGDNGHVRVARNKGNICGIATKPLTIHVELIK